MERKFGTLLSIIIVLLGVIHYFVKSPIIPLSMGVLFLILLGMALVKAVKEKERWRVYGVIGLTVILAVLMLNYFNIF